jgi:spore coat polysaccharide biosynthesis protein SpsF
MRVIAVLQARTGSSRLPGKVMADLAGKPLLARVIERAQVVPGVHIVVVATTQAERDRPILELANACGAKAYAGSEEDVLDRYYQAARQFGGEVVVRLTADCPLLDPGVSARVLERYLKGDVDYASNTLAPTFPDGLDTEVFSFAALERAWRESGLASEREHVTPYIWKNPLKFRLAGITDEVNRSGLRWTVDEAQDLEFVRAVYKHLYRDGEPPFGMDEVLALLETKPELKAMNTGFLRNEGYAKSLREDRQIE